MLLAKHCRHAVMHLIPYLPPLQPLYGYAMPAYRYGSLASLNRDTCDRCVPVCAQEGQELLPPAGHAPTGGGSSSVAPAHRPRPCRQQVAG